MPSICSAKLIAGVSSLTSINRNFLYIILFFAAFALSTSAIFVKLSDAPSTIIAGYRMLFSALILLPFLLLKKANWHELKMLSKKQWLLGILSGVFLAAHYTLWFESLRFTSVASSTVLVTLQPLFAFIGGYFLFGEINPPFIFWRALGNCRKCDYRMARFSGQWNCFLWRCTRINRCRRHHRLFLARAKSSEGAITCSLLHYRLRKQCFLSSWLFNALWLFIDRIRGR
ncbi:MAG: hypothetical protein K0Q56_765 [Sporolactobacillus laevolacticus]|nr:hypothetical protein [Sporolactobacillus laevolacticus]